MVVRPYEFAIVPHVGIGPLRFGMLATDIYQILGQPSRRRGPNEFSAMTRERFMAHDCFVDFRPDGRCCAAELYPDARVVLDGVNLMAMTYKSLVIHLRTKGASVIEEGDGFRCDDLGISCYAPELGDPELADARIESLSAYTRGYYDELDQYVAKMRWDDDN